MSNLAYRKYLSFIIKIKRLPRYSLQLLFNFDKWHTINLSERKYVVDIITYLNNLPLKTRNSVIEIGCGLGDIVRHLKFKVKAGYDMETNVLNAARFLNKLNGDKIEFAEFNFPDTALTNKYNVIILVNWIHNIAPEVLKKEISSYFLENLLQNGCIIIDTVQAKNYRFNHDINYLTANLPCEVIKIGSYENERNIYAIFKH